MHIQHIALMVRDIEKSIKFYETITELKVDRRMKAGQGEISFLTNGKDLLIYVYIFHVSRM